MLMSCIDLIAKKTFMSARRWIWAEEQRQTNQPGLADHVVHARGKAVLINIFGGITRCDEVAQGVRDAVQNDLGKGQFVIVRMEGTNKEKASKCCME